MRLKPQLQGALLTLVGEAIVLIGIWLIIGIRLGIWSYDEYERYIWLTIKIPVARRLWHGDVKPGDDVEQLARAWRPHQISRYGQWVDLVWFPDGMPQDAIPLISICVTAKDGKLVSASFYPDDGLCGRDFFDTLTPLERADYAAALTTHCENLGTQGQDTVRQEGDASGGSPFDSNTR